MATTWTLAFPAPDRMLSVNSGKHWSVTSAARRTWREVTFQHAKAAKLPKGLGRVRIDIEMRFPTAARRDESNYSALVAKPIVDALSGERMYRKPSGVWVREVGYGLIPDDNPKRHLHCRSCPHLLVSDQRGPRPYGEVVITITDLSEVPDAADV
jgi:hypothetical protein